MSQDAAAPVAAPLSGAETVSRPLRIVHVTHQYRPALGGSEQYVINISEELARRGHQVHAFTTRSRNYRTWRNELSGQETLDGVEVRRFASIERRAYTWRLLDHGYINYRRARSWIYQPLILYGSGPISPGLFLNLLLRGPHYDVIHVNTLPYAHFWYAYLAARLRRVPLVATPFLHVKQADIFDVGCFNAALRGADVVMAMTGVERDYLVARGVRPERIVMGGVGLKPQEVIPAQRGNWRAQLGIPEGAFAVLFLGRRAEYKGLDTLLEMHARKLAQDGRSVLLLAGPTTPYWEDLRKRYQGVPGVLDFGQVSDADKSKLLDACDALVLPSTGESFGIVFVEAWMLGKAVVGARSGAIADMIAEGEDGLLFAPGDVDDLACKLELLRDNADLRHFLGENGYQKAMSRYTVERVSDELEKVYRTLAARRSPR
jgi:glycosyltransferase involved in cell wall biosynthesis